MVLQNRVAELEEQVKELTGRISGLMSDKAALDSRVGILNRVLRMREEHIEMLQRKVGPRKRALERTACAAASSASVGLPGCSLLVSRARLWWVLLLAGLFGQSAVLSPHLLSGLRPACCQWTGVAAAISSRPSWGHLHLASPTSLSPVQHAGHLCQ